MPTMNSQNIRASAILQPADQLPSHSVLIRRSAVLPTGNRRLVINGRPPLKKEDHDRNEESRYCIK